MHSHNEELLSAYFWYEQFPLLIRSNFKRNIYDQKYCVLIFFLVGLSLTISTDILLIFFFQPYSRFNFHITIVHSIIACRKLMKWKFFCVIYWLSNPIDLMRYSHIYRYAAISYKKEIITLRCIFFSQKPVDIMNEWIACDR